MIVRLHTLLQARGGAARVAGLLAGGLKARGVEAERTFEARDSDEETGELAPPRDVFPRLPAGALLHLHSSGDWETLLSGGLASGFPPGRAVLTLHDCSLLTGGCAYPLECGQWLDTCPGPCPRGFARDCRTRLALVRRLRPILVTPSRWLGDMARRVLPDLSTVIIPNGVEWPDSLEDRAEARRALGLGPRLPVALFVAHGGERAAYHAGFKWRSVWEAIRAEAPGAAAMFVGGFETRREGSLFCWPYVDRRTLGLFMRASDVLVYPSLADNHPLVILEAMAAGLPAVSFDTGGIREQIEDGRTGVLVPAGDWDGLVRASARLLGRPRQARLLGDEAFARGRGRFSLERMVESHMRLYERITCPE